MEDGDGRERLRSRVEGRRQLPQVEIGEVVTVGGEEDVVVADELTAGA